MKNSSDKTLKQLKTIEKIVKSSYEEISADYQRIIVLSEWLGENGWTDDSKINPNEMRTRQHLIEGSGEGIIANQYSEEEIQTILELIEKQYEGLPERWYVNRAIENYNAGRFTEAAVFFMCLLDYRITKFTPKQYRKKRGQCKDGLKEEGKNLFDKSNDRPLSRFFLITRILPSFSAFAKRLFVDGDKYNLDTGTEPSFLNRNWLLHGRMTRRVKRFECVQLICACRTLIEIETF